MFFYLSPNFLAHWLFWHFLSQRNFSIHFLLYLFGLLILWEWEIIPWGLLANKSPTLSRLHCSSFWQSLQSYGKTIHTLFIICLCQEGVPHETWERKKKQKKTKAESLTSAKFEYILFLTVKILEFLKILLVFIQTKKK